MTSTPEQVIARIRDRVGTEFDDEATFTAEEVEEIAVLLDELASLRKAKWDVKHVDTMNDMASLAVALKAAEAERDALGKALERIAEANPRSTNSSSANDAFAFCAAIAETALDRDGARTLLAGDNHG